jgi:hypothetical protein
MRLALKLKILNMEDMLNNMICSEFVEWQNFALLEPFGAQVDELHLAGIRSQIANYLRKPNSAGYTASDFMMTQTKKREQSISEIFQMMGGDA